MMNNFSVIEQIVLSILIILAFSSFGYEVLKRLKIVAKGTPSFTFDNIPQRLIRLIKEYLFQSKVIGQRFWPGLMHAFVFWGFLAFGLITVNHFALGFNSGLFSDELRHMVAVCIGFPWSVLVLIGILSLAYRRFIIRPKPLGTLSVKSGIVAIFISLLMITYIYGEGFHPQGLVFKINWWLHALLILGFLTLIPRSKHLHLVLAPFNIFFKPFTIPAHEPVVIDMEAEEEALDEMLNQMTNMTQKMALDLFSCVECGRCSEVCPVTRGEGVLDPKHHFILDQKKEALSQNSSNILDKIQVDAGWECTTCQACTEVCPVGNQVERSDEIRRLQVLVEGNVPPEYQKVFMNIQNTGNTEGASGNGFASTLPTFSSEKEYVLWLGCFTRHSVDPNFMSSVDNFLKVIDKSGISFGVLEDEQCTGDPANRLGDKLTFSMQMEHNMEQLADAKKIITMCPHCSVTLGQEYSKYNKIPYTVEHHTQFLSRMLNDGKISVNSGALEKVTYHDPCNLSRFMGETEAPRNVIKSIAPNYFEQKEHSRKTVCCGAGGGQWWKKDTQGHTHLVRPTQVLESKANTVITACNYCYAMINQGLPTITPEGETAIVVKDIADLVAENMDE